MPEQGKSRDETRWLWVLGLVNFALFLWLVRGSATHFALPWDGPAVATLALTAATVVLAAVAIVVALVGILGYDTLRKAARSEAAAEAGRILPELHKRWAEGIPQTDRVKQAYE